jgi:hypothetical protein
MSELNVKYYTILAGRKEPAKVLQGALSKSSGQPTGDVQKVSVVVGAIVLPNYSRVWGRRIASGSRGDSKSMQVTDRAYTGEIEFLVWGDPKGEAIEIRYLRQSQSLDKQFQEQIQKLKPADNGDDAFINLQQGLNNFSEREEKMKALMLKHHTLNYSNPSRDPSNNDYDFVEYDSKSRNKSRVEKLSIKNEVNNFVLSLRDDNGNPDSSKVRILAAIFNLDSQLDDGVLLEKILDKGEDMPVEFLKTITDYKHKVDILLEDAVDMKVIEFKKNSVMVIEDEKTTTLLRDIEGADEKDQRIWLVQQVLANVTVYDAMVRLEKAFEISKRKQLV